MEQRIYFVNSRGYTLAGVLNVPSAPAPYPVVIFSHGFDSSKNSPRSVPISDELVGRGIATFLFDYTGHGESEGTKRDSTITQQLDDLRHAVTLVELRDDIDKGKIGLHGSSSGCLTCLYLSLEHRIATMVLRAPRTNGEFPDLYEHAGELRTPTLFIQGTNDPLLPQTERFFRAMTAPASLQIIEGADHLFTDPEDYRVVVALTVDWFKKQLAGGFENAGEAA